MHQIRYAPGSIPDPAGGAHDAPPYPLVGWGGRYPLHISLPSTPSASRSLRLSRVGTRCRSRRLVCPQLKFCSRASDSPYGLQKSKILWLLFSFVLIDESYAGRRLTASVPKLRRGFGVELCCCRYVLQRFRPRKQCGQFGWTQS